jgi:hypothetical protein
MGITCLPGISSLFEVPAPELQKKAELKMMLGTTEETWPISQSS